MNDQDDLELLRAWTAGDRKAGELLYRRYFRLVYRFFRSKTPGAAQDLTQATFVALTKSCGNFKQTGTFRAFVLGIARHRLLRYFRSRSRDRIELPGEELSCADLGVGPFELVAGTEEQKLLVKALRRIPVDHQILIELHYWEELNATEIAEVLGSPPSTIRDRKRKALALLREQLEQMMDGDERVESTMMGLKTWRYEIHKKIEEQADEPADEPADDAAE